MLVALYGDILPGTVVVQSRGVCAIPTGSEKSGGSYLVEGMEGRREDGGGGKGG